MMYHWGPFRVLRTTSGFYLLGSDPDHHSPTTEINRRVGKKVVDINGSGFGVNLRIVDMQAWSDFVSIHITDTDDGMFMLDLPDPPLRCRPDRHMSESERAEWLSGVG